MSKLQPIEQPAVTLIADPASNEETNNSRSLERSKYGGYSIVRQAGAIKRTRRAKLPWLAKRVHASNVRLSVAKPAPTPAATPATVQRSVSTAAGAPTAAPRANAISEKAQLQIMSHDFTKAFFTAGFDNSFQKSAASHKQAWMEAFEEHVARGNAAGKMREVAIVGHAASMAYLVANDKLAQSTDALDRQYVQALKHNLGKIKEGANDAFFMVKDMSPEAARTVLQTALKNVLAIKDVAPHIFDEPAVDNVPAAKGQSIPAAPISEPIAAPIAEPIAQPNAEPIAAPIAESIATPPKQIPVMQAKLLTPAPATEASEDVQAAPVTPAKAETKAAAPIAAFQEILPAPIADKEELTLLAHEAARVSVVGCPEFEQSYEAYNQLFRREVDTFVQRHSVLLTGPIMPRAISAAYNTTPAFANRQNPMDIQYAKTLERNFPQIYRKAEELYSSIKDKSLTIDDARRALQANMDVAEKSVATTSQPAPALTHVKERVSMAFEYATDMHCAPTGKFRKAARNYAARFNTAFEVYFKKESLPGVSESRAAILSARKASIAIAKLMKNSKEPMERAYANELLRMMPKMTATAREQFNATKPLTIEDARTALQVADKASKTGKKGNIFTRLFGKKNKA